MTTFPGSPNLMKGAIVGFDMFNPLASVIIFQYNPKSLSRTLAPQMAGGAQGSKAEVLRLSGPPQETISVDLEIEAADQLEQGDGIAQTMGIYPQLSALEMLVYPKSALVIANTVLMFAGTIEVIQPAAPLTLFIWGPKRVLPVKIESFSITEKEYVPNLNPILADVGLSLKVLSYSDFSVTHPGYYVFLAHQVVKEVMGTISSVGSIAATGSSKVSI